MKPGRERLRGWITRSELKQVEAARLLGIGEVFLSQILKGIRTPALATAVRIERVTGVAVESWVLRKVSPKAVQAPRESDNTLLARR